MTLMLILVVLAGSTILAEAQNKTVPTIVLDSQWFDTSFDAPGLLDRGDKGSMAAQLSNRELREILKKKKAEEVARKAGRLSTEAPEPQHQSEQQESSATLSGQPSRKRSREEDEPEGQAEITSQIAAATPSRLGGPRSPERNSAVDALRGVDKNAPSSSLWSKDFPLSDFLDHSIVLEADKERKEKVGMVGSYQYVELQLLRSLSVLRTLEVDAVENKRRLGIVLKGLKSESDHAKKAEEEVNRLRNAAEKAEQWEKEESMNKALKEKAEEELRTAKENFAKEKGLMAKTLEASLDREAVLKKDVENLESWLDSLELEAAVQREIGFEKGIEQAKLFIPGGQVDDRFGELGAFKAIVDGHIVDEEE